MTTYKNRNRGLTLIKLLVMIAILGLLTSIIIAFIKGITGKTKIAKTLRFSQSVLSDLGSDAIGIWSFDEGSGTTASDASGNGNHGRLLPAASPPTWTTTTPYQVAGAVAGKYALSFDGLDDKVDCGKGSSLNNISGSQPYTLEAWIKPARLPDGMYGIIDKGRYGAEGFGIHTNGNLINFGFHGWGNFNSNTTLSPGQWYHIVGVHVAADNNYIFINGIKDAHCTSLCNLDVKDHGDYNLYIGYLEKAGYFPGIIDEVRIYGRALTPAEIQKHYAQGLERRQNLVRK